MIGRAIVSALHEVVLDGVADLAGRPPRSPPTCTVSTSSSRVYVGAGPRPASFTSSWRALDACRARAPVAARCSCSGGALPSDQ